MAPYPTSLPLRRPLLTALLGLTLGIANAQTQLEPASAPRHGGTYHVATGTWSPASPGQTGSLGLGSGAGPLYRNDALNGQFIQLQEQQFVVDSARVPGLSSGGTSDCYFVDQFDIAYATAAPTLSAEMLFFEGYAPCMDPNQVQPIAHLQVPNLPGSPGPFQASWIITIDLVGSGFEFILPADGGDGSFDGNPAQDNFGFGIRLFGHQNDPQTGILAAGDPNQFEFGDGTLFTNPGAPQGTGLGQTDEFLIADPQNPACLDFGGYPGAPWAGVYLTLLGGNACCPGDLNCFEAQLFEPGTKSTPPAAPSYGPCEVCPDDEADDMAFIDPVYGFSGEFYLEETDLHLPGRGLDFLWTRKYRSRIQVESAQGHGWDFSYNIFLEPDGSNLRLHDGHTRRDLFTLQGDGSWAAPEQFQVITLHLDGTFQVTWPDTGHWLLNPLDGSPAQGKIQAISDRNGNTLTFDYDLGGQLVTVRDTLHSASNPREYTLIYTGEGFVQSVTDFTGRSLTYDYYEDGDAGGSAGDLKSVTTPVVTGTVTGNDFPSGKTTTYTYSTGFADETLNHNLLTITDPRGQTWLVNEYGTDAGDPFHLDRILRQNWGDAGDVVDLFYIPLVPDVTNNFAVVSVTANDRVGNVSEHMFDDANREVVRLEYTGRANADLPTTDSSNLPTGQLRPTDPAVFETRWEYNADSLVTSTLFPNGNTELWVHDEGNPERRAQGNPLSHVFLPGLLGGDQGSLVETFEYDDGFGGGCCGVNFVSRHVDERGNETLNTYDSVGNRLTATHPIPSIVETFEYNPFGQLTRHIQPANGHGSQREDVFTYYGELDGVMNGYVHERIVDAQGLALTTTYEYDACGRVVREEDPRGGDSLFVFNALDQEVSELAELVDGTRYETRTFYDANDNLVRRDVQNVDADGVTGSNAWFTTIYEYEILNNPVRECRESGNYTGAIPGTTNLPTCAGLPEEEFVTLEFEYDANRNVTLIRNGEATEGRQPDNVVTTLYDERDLLFQETRAPGTPDASTFQFDYDGNENVTSCTKGLEDTPRTADFTYDGYDRLVGTQDPMGNGVEVHYDAGGNVVQELVWGELLDVPGTTGNVRLWERTCVWDDMDRLTQETLVHFDDGQAPILDGNSVRLTSWSDDSQIVSETNDNGHTTTYEYDTANRRVRETDASGNETRLEYDANSNVIEERLTDVDDLGGPDQVFVTTHGYDSLDRCVTTTDSSGNLFQFDHDSRGNRTLEIDGRGNRSLYTYDGLERQVRTERTLTGDGTGGGLVVGSIVTTQAWDDSNRLVAQGDANEHGTVFSMDALDRVVATELADGTVHTATYDVHDNLVSRTDANGSVIESGYDLLDRLTTTVITPAAGVSADTTFETFAYDGLSRLVSAVDDDSSVARSYDSLGNLLVETQGGQSTVYRHDGASNMVEVVYPGGRVVTRTFDALERVSEIRDETGTPTSLATYDYIGAGRVTRRSLGNGTRLDLTYDGIQGVANPAGDHGVRRVVRSVHSMGGHTLDEREARWDEVGNRTLRRVITDQTTSWHYRYDSADRLTSSRRQRRAAGGGLVGTGTSQRRTYAYDGVGNRMIEEVTSAGPVGGGTYSQSAALPLLDAQVNQYSSTPRDSRQYDQNGNLVRIDSNLPGEETLGYDARNRLVSHTSQGTLTRYSYDALGRRIEHRFDVNGTNEVTRFAYCVKESGFLTQESLYLWSFLDDVCEEQDASGTTLATYVHGAGVDEVLTMERGATYWYHADDMGNVVALTDDSGVLVERYAYDDFGRLVNPGSLEPLSGAPSSVGNPYLFTGRRHDGESGLHQMRARYLDPEVGRFTSRDPLGSWADLQNLGNATTYCGNNPWSFVDPTGLLTWDCFVACMLGMTTSELQNVTRIFRKLGLGTKISSAIGFLSRGSIRPAFAILRSVFTAGASALMGAGAGAAGVSGAAARATIREIGEAVGRRLATRLLGLIGGLSLIATGAEACYCAWKCW